MQRWNVYRSTGHFPGGIKTVKLGTVEADNHADARLRAFEQFGRDYTGLALEPLYKVSTVMKRIRKGRK
jgi:hypothetical protein